MKKALVVTLIITALFSCSKKEEELIGQIEINGPVLYNHITSQISLNVSPSAVKVTYYLDGASIGSSITPPYLVSYTPIDIVPGDHLITCVAELSSGKEQMFEKSIPLVVRIGDQYRGGVIFFIDNTGLHGLIAAAGDLMSGSEIIFKWGQSSILNTSKTSGQENTQKMITVSPDATFAAYYFKNGLNQAGYTDWYIPSIEELKTLKGKKEVVGGFSTESGSGGLYWSSSELSETNAEALQFNVLMGNSYVKNIAWLKIRPIRKF